MEHTKGKLRIIKYSATAVETDQGRLIGSFGSFTDGTEKVHLENIANANRIVECWNTHDKLVADNKAMMEMLEEIIKRDVYDGKIKFTIQDQQKVENFLKTVNE